MKVETIVAAVTFFASLAWAGSEVAKRSQIPEIERLSETQLAKRAAEPKIPTAQPWRREWEQADDDGPHDIDLGGSGASAGSGVAENLYGRQLWRMEKKEDFRSLMKAATKA